MTNLQKAKEYLECRDIPCFIDDGSLSIESKSRLNFQLSSSEVDYRADCYDDDYHNELSNYLGVELVFVTTLGGVKYYDKFVGSMIKDGLMYDANYDRYVDLEYAKSHIYNKI